MTIQRYTPTGACADDGPFVAYAEYAKLLAAAERVRAVLEARKAEIEADERYHYKPATTDENAVLALIQFGMETEMGLIERALAKPKETR